MKTALLLVDIQNDFIPGGALAVPDGDVVVSVANRLMDRFGLVVASQDWHPANHGSFVSRNPGKAVGDIIDLDGIDQIVWPDHCVEHTHGAAFVAGLNTDRIDHVVRKGTDADIDSYSIFFDNGHRKETGLQQYLKDQAVKRLVLVGLATDYCVKYSALDAREIGFEVILVTDGVRGVELKSGDCEKAVSEMKAAGVQTATSAQLMEQGAGLCRSAAS